MGLSNYIASVLTLCLGKFLSGFSSETVRANVLSGCVRVKSINILSSTLPHFPFDILCGSIGSISVSIPWRSLHKTLCRIEVHDVSIVIALAASDSASGDESATESKKRLLRHLRAPGHLISDNEKLSALGLLKRIQRAILNKIVLVIDDSCFLVVFSAQESPVVQLLQIDVPKLTSRTAECSMDNLSSEKLTIRREFVCNDIALSVGKCPHRIWQDWKDANGFSLRKFVQQSVGMSTLLKNLHATLTVEYCSQTSISSGMVKCNVHVEPGKVSLSAEVLCNMLQIASVVTSVDSVNQSPGGKNTCTPQEKWQLALSRIRAQRESQHFSWKHYIEWKRLYHSYYVQCLEALSPNAGISKMAFWADLSEAEKLLTCDDLLACWAQARDTTRRYRDLSVVDPWRPYSHMARNGEPVHCSSFVVKAFVNWERLTVGLDGAFLTVHDVLFNMVVDGPSRAVSCKVSTASLERSLQKSNGESLELVVLDEPSLSFRHDGDGDATLVTDTQRVRCSMSTSDFSALVEILGHYKTLYKELQPLYASASKASNGPRSGCVKESRKKPLPICLRVTKAVFALHNIVAHWTNVSIQSNAAALLLVWETAVVKSGEDEIARVHQVSARLVATKRHLLVGALQVVISENLEGLERLKQTIALVRLSIGPSSTTSDGHSSRSGPTAPFDVQCNISSITFACIQAGNWSILASVGNGFTVTASCLGLEADGQTVPEARMSLRLWTGSWLSDAPTEMGMKQPGGLGFHGEVCGLRVRLEDSITSAIEHLYDAVILLMNEAEDVHVYLRSACRRSPNTSGQITVHNSWIGFPSDDTGSIPELTVHGGDSGLVVSLGRYADKRMWVTIALGDSLGAYTVSGSSAPAEIFPYPSGGSFVVKMSTFHPVAEDLELFPFRRLRINVLAVNRCIVVHHPTLQALWAHFNNPLAAMGRIRAIASRVHFSCRSSRNRPLPPTSPASKILSMKAAESCRRSTFNCVPPVDKTSVSPPPGFPWDLDVSFKVHAVVVLYPLNASGSICLRSEFSHSHASLTSRAASLRMDARSNATFPQIVTSSGGILGAAAYRGTKSNRKHHREDVKRTATLSLRLIYTNDSRPPFHTGVSDESLHVSLRSDRGGPIEGRWDDTEFATWLALSKVLHEPSDARAAAAAVSHDKPRPRRLLSTISIAPVLWHVPSLDCAVVVWGGVQGSLSPGSQTWSVPRLSILHNRQFREWRELSVKTAEQLLRDGDRDTVVVCQISPTASPPEAVGDRTVPSSTREALAILYASHLGNSISDPRRRTELSLGIITCTLSEDMGISWIAGSAVARGQSLLQLVMHQLSILRQDAPVSGKEERFGELAAAETPDGVVQWPSETAVALEGLSVAMEWWSSWRRHKVSVGCRLSGVRYVQSTGTEWISRSSSSSFTFTGMAASSLLGEGQDDVMQQHTPPKALTVTLASGQFFMSLIDSSSAASGTTLETTDDAFGAYSKRIPLSEVFHLSTDYLPPPSSLFRTSDACSTTDTTLLVPHLILSPIHFKLTELPYAFLFELPQRLKQLSARVARTDRRMGSPSESEAPVSDSDAAEGEVGDVASTSSSRASTLFTANSFDSREGVTAAAQVPGTTTDLPTIMTELSEEAVGGVGDSKTASATTSRHERTRRDSPWSSIVYQVTAVGLQIAAAASSSTPEESPVVDSCSSSNHPRKGKDCRGSPRTTPSRADDQSTKPCCTRSSRSPRVVGFSRISVDTGYSGGSSPGRVILDVFVGLMTVHRQGGSGGAWNFLCTEVNCKSYDSTMVQASTVLPLAAMQGIRCTLPSATAASLSSIRREGSAAQPPRQAEGSDVSSAKVGVVGMSVESVTVSLSVPDARPLLSILVEVPARSIFPCYRGAATGGRRDGASPSSAATPRRQSALRLTRISGETWVLDADLYLSRREHVLYFSSKDTNHLTVDMNGHCIHLLAGRDADDPREPWGGQQADRGDTRAAHMVMAVEDGLTLTFTHGSFRLPLHTWSNVLQEAIGSNGVEKAILRFVGLGEGSYIQCEEVRLGFEERRRVAVRRGGGREGARGKRHRDRSAWTPLTRFREREPPVDACEPSRRGGGAARTRRWRLQVASLSVSVRGAGEPRCLCLQTSVRVHVEVGHGATRGIDAKIEALSLSTSPWTAGVEVAAAVPGTRPASEVVLQPIDVDVCIAGSNWAVSCGDLRIDLTRADVQTVRALLDSITSTRAQTKYLTSSPVERQYLLLLDATLAWRTAVYTHEATGRQQLLSAPPKDGTDGGDRDHRSSSLVDDVAAATAGTTAPVPPSTTTQLSVAVFIPSVEATISDVRYPLIRGGVRDVCVRLTSPHAAMRTTSLQCHGLLVRVYGKGRWDTLVRATPVWQVSWTQTTSRNSSNDHLAITGEGCDVQSSYMILSKVLFAGRRAAFVLRPLMAEGGGAKTGQVCTDDDDEATESSRCDDAETRRAQAATHRFVNHFNCTFFLLVGAEDATSGEWLVLRPGASVDACIPYKRASDAYVFVFPDDCVDVTQDRFAALPRYQLNRKGKQQDLSHARVLVCALQYGQATGLVMNQDLLVVLSCTDQEAVPAAATPWNFTACGRVGGEDGEAAYWASRKAAGAGDRDVASTTASPTTQTGTSLSDLCRSGSTEAGLVVVQVHAKMTLCNDSGIPLQVQQQRMEEDATAYLPRVPMPPGRHFPLCGSCVGLVLKCAVGPRIYSATLSVLGLSSGTFIELWPELPSSSARFQDTALSSKIERMELRADAKADGRPVVLFVVARHLPESLSTSIFLHPRLTVINHMGIPIRVSLWQQDSDAGPQCAADVSCMQPWKRVSVADGGGGRRSQVREAFYGSLIPIGASNHLPHLGAIPVVQCSFQRNLVMGLYFTQCTGDDIYTEDLVEVVSVLEDAMEGHPRLLPLRDANGRTFIVQVTVLVRTVILSVGVWVTNLTEYPLQMTDGIVRRQLCAGQNPTTGIIPSRGTPFLIGCRLQDFAQVFFKIGLDSAWSDAIPVVMGSSGVLESHQPDLQITRSSNYAILFPNAQEGRPLVFVISPRWIVYNDTGKQLRLFFDYPGMKKAVLGAARAARQAELDGDPVPDAEMAAVSSVASIVLKPGEHHVSCVGTLEGNRLALQEVLDGTVPSVASITDQTEQRCRISEYYVSQRTNFMSVDAPGQATFNLWAAPRSFSVQQGVSYGRALTVSRPSWDYLHDLAAFDPYHDEAVVTGRLAVSVEEAAGMLAIVLQPVRATKVRLQNRTAQNTVMVRQEGSRRRNMVPPRRNRYFLWEDSAGEHVIRVHIVGWKGQWFRVDFGGGDCRVSRHRAAEDDTASLETPAVLPFYVHGVVNKEKTLATIVITDRAVPSYALLSHWRRSFALSLRVAVAQATWLSTGGAGSHPESDPTHAVFSSRPQRLASWVLEGVAFDVVDTEDSRYFQVAFNQMQVLDELHATVVLYRARMIETPGTAPPAGEPSPPPWRGPYSPTGLWGSAAAGFRRSFSRGGSSPAQSPGSQPRQYAPPMRSPRQVSIESSASAVSSLHYDRVAAAQGRELPCDVVLQYSSLKYADGMVRLTDVNVALTALVVVVTDTWLAQVLYEVRRLRHLLRGGTPSPAELRSMMMRGAVRPPSCGSPAMAAGGCCTPNGEENTGAFSSSSGVVGRQPIVTRDAGAAMAVMNITRFGFVPQPRFIAMALRNLGCVAGGGGGSQLRGSAASAPPPSFLFIEHFRTSRVTLYMSFVRHRPDPLRPLLGAYTLMLPTTLAQRELHLAPLTITKQLETTGSLQARIRRWAMHGLRHQWTKVTKIGTMLDKLRWWRGELPLRRAPRALTSARVRRLTARTVAEAMASHDCPVAWTDVKLPFMASEDTSDDECEGGGGL